MFRALPPLSALLAFTIGALGGALGDSQSVAQGAAVIEIVSSTGRPYTSSTGTYYKIVGEVKNSGTTNAGLAVVTASLLGSSGQILAAGDSSYVFRVLAPGDMTPFSVLVSYPNPSEVTSFKLQASAQETSITPYNGLVSLSTNVYTEYSWSTSQTLVGEILNTGTGYASFPLDGILVAEYDGQGKLIDFDRYAYSHLNTLMPGQRTPFKVRLDSDLPIASVRVLAAGVPASTFPTPLIVTRTNEYVSGSRRHVVGTVENRSSVAAKYLRVVATFRDSDGVARYTETSSQTQELAPGQQSPFSIEIASSLAFASYDLQADSSGQSAPAPYPAPLLVGPAGGSTLASLGTLFTWVSPPGSTQVQLQVIPAKNDGPGVNVIQAVRGDFRLSAPSLGVGNYLMLPGMSYSWRVRASTSTSPLGESDPGWGPWSEAAVFRTPTPTSSGVSAVVPAPDSTLFGSGPTVVQWRDSASGIFYYELQMSRDGSLGEEGPNSAVWHNLIHGGVSTPLSSWLTPPLESGVTYYWRVRPRVQGDGTPVAWSATWSFRTS